MNSEHELNDTHFAKTIRILLPHPFLSLALRLEKKKVDLQAHHSVVRIILPAVYIRYYAVAISLIGFAVSETGWEAAY